MRRPRTGGGQRAKGKIALTGRTDNFLQGRNDLDDTIRRLTAFAEASADVLYAPYPRDLAAVEVIVKAVAPKPVNLVVGTMAGTPTVAEIPAAGSQAHPPGRPLHPRRGLPKIVDYNVHSCGYPES